MTISFYTRHGFDLPKSVALAIDDATTELKYIFVGLGFLAGLIGVPIILIYLPTVIGWFAPQLQSFFASNLDLVAVIMQHRQAAGIILGIVVWILIMSIMVNIVVWIMTMVSKNYRYRSLGAERPILAGLTIEQIALVDYQIRDRKRSSVSARAGVGNMVEYGFDNSFGFAAIFGGCVLALIIYSVLK